MKKISILIGIIASSTLMTSCKELNGYLSVKESFAMKNKRGESITFKSGSNVRVKMNKESEMKLVLQDANGKRQVIPVKTNFDVHDISNGDRVMIPSRISGQPFDISGIYNDTNRYSESHDGIESCQVAYRAYECRDVLVPCNNSGERGCSRQYQRQCGDVTLYRNGHRNVRYHYVTNDVNFDLNLIKDGRIIATIDSSQSSSNKRYEYTGTCFAY